MDPPTTTLHPLEMLPAPPMKPASRLLPLPKERRVVMGGITLHLEINQRGQKTGAQRRG